MAAAKVNQVDNGVGDPSANVLLLVGNATKYLEELHKQSEIYYHQKLASAMEAINKSSEAESKRIDANRDDDRKAVGVATEGQAKQATLLAEAVATNAETLRVSMAKTAETLATQLQQVTNSLSDRIKVVELKQYETAGTSKGGKDMWGWIVSAILLIITIIQFWKG